MMGVGYSLVEGLLEASRCTLSGFQTEKPHFHQISRNTANRLPPKLATRQLIMISRRKIREIGQEVPSGNSRKIDNYLQKPTRISLHKDHKSDQGFEQC
jgi:hypothetical protein